MNDPFTKAEHFILREYDTAVRFTYHVDELRNAITRFQITFSGAAVAGVLLVVDREREIDIANLELFLFVFLLIIFGIGVLFVAVIARLRRGQLERYRIINNIRTHFLVTHPDLKRVAELSTETLTVAPKLNTGSYFWILCLILLNSLVFWVSFQILFQFIVYIPPPGIYLLTLGLALIATKAQHCIYFALAAPPPPTS